MEANNWRPPQPEPAMDAGDWRTQLQPDSRQRIVNKIMETLKRHLPHSGQEGWQELTKIAMRFEEKIYVAATSQSDYLRKISLKMLTMDSKSQNTLPNALSSNSTGMSKNPQDPASQNLQPQVHNPTQSLSIPMAPNQSQAQARQQLLAQTIQNNIASAGMQTSVSLPPSLPTVSGLAQNSIANTNVSQNSNLQNISGISQNSMANSLGQGVSSNMLTNAQRQMQGRQHSQQVGPQLQTQNPQQYIYQQQLQQQILKQKLHQGNIQPPLMQPHLKQQQQPPPQQQQQQQNVLQQSQLQPSQQSVLHTSSVMPASVISGLQQNQQPSIQQPSQSLLQQHQQSILRQQSQSQQTAGILQPQTQMPQQQQLMGQQTSAANLQQNNLIGQPNSIPDIQQQQQQQPQQQRLPVQASLPSLPSQQQNNYQNLQQQQLMGQKTNLSNIHQQQLGPQSHGGGLSQQQQLLGTQSGNSSMQPNQQLIHIMQQSKIPLQQQTQNASALLTGGGQQSQSQPQQQSISQIQSQPSQLQQQMGLQQQPNSLQHNIHQRLQPSTALLQQRNLIDQQKQNVLNQREGPSTSLDSTSQTGNAGDWQEEVYQKIKTMKEMYYADLNEMYQRISSRLQQHDSHSLPQQPKTDQLEKLKFFKQMLEKTLQFLQLTKNNISPSHREKLGSYERQIVTFLTSNRPRKPISSLQQGQLPPPHMQSVQQTQTPHAQIPQAQSQDSGMNPQLQPLNFQSSVPMVQQRNVASLQHCSAPLSAIASSQPNMINSLQSGSNLDSGQGNAISSLQPVGMGSLQHNPVNAPQQANVNSLPLQSGLNLLHPNINTVQSNSNLMQSQHLKQQQEQHIMQSQQLKQQIQQRQIQQQLQKQQILQQQTKQQQPGKMQAHAMPQLQQLSDSNELKTIQDMAKPAVLSQQLSQGQRYPHQQVKSGTSFQISSPQLLQSTSPPINQHSSPQIDQKNVLPTLTKVGTPLQSANSPFVVPSPPTPLAPSPMPGDSEKPNYGLSSLSNAANVVHQQATGGPAPTLSLAIGTPGISASPLLAEFTGSDGNHGNAPIISGKSGVTEQPLERLLKVVKSMSSSALEASVSDIGSVVSMTDRIAGSAPGNGSRAAIGEDLVAMTKCRLQARNLITQDGSSGTKRMNRCTSAIPLNVASSSVGSIDDSFKQLAGSDTSELELSKPSNIKRLRRNERNHILWEEIRYINERLIDTVVDITAEDVDPAMTSAAAEGGEGTIVKCSYAAVALCPDLKSQYASAQMLPIQPLRLLVPANYPNCSPILLDKFPVEASKEYEDLSLKAKSRFSISLRTLSQPMSLKEIARTWDDCTRTVMSEYAQQNGGGTFSSKYGTWENCLSAA
ncbi:hypothetical protein Nepgr_006928 [Nepenthes gracilis]|uniref:Mediator complex subunit 15 KIX domain-containing protein n=1 Tax=Nepenthes gracilis TaxID=150966 RepID=A0AAD3S5X6_NEPGR|nr:hypothetical protein Nepgr_006928 [Nepenthes gracilis]